MKHQIALALALAAAPFAASAQHSYTYVEGGYAQIKLDNVAEYGSPHTGVVRYKDLDTDGFFVGGSIELVGSLYAFGAYRDGSGDLESSWQSPFTDAGYRVSIDADTTQYNLGLGYHWGLSDRTDLLAELSYYSTEVDVDVDTVFGDPAGLDGDDVRASVGVRHWMADSVEVWGKASFTDGDAYDQVVSGTLGLQWKLTEHWGLVGEIEGGGGYSQFPVGARASF